MGINSFRGQWRRSARLTISYCVHSKCHVVFSAIPSREGYIVSIGILDGRCCRNGEYSV